MKVTYDAQVCIHAGNCGRSLPAVFKVVNGQFVLSSTNKVRVKGQAAKRLRPARLAPSEWLMTNPRRTLCGCPVGAGL